MKPGLFFAATVAAFLSGCAMPVTHDDIDWRVPVLSEQGCPNITGTYLNTGGLFVLITGGVRLTHEVATVQDIRTIPRGTLTHSLIRHDPGALHIVLTDSANEEYLRGTVRFAPAKVGCQNGALIIRNVRNVAKAESAYGSVQLSETEIQKLPDGNLHVTRWSGERMRSNLTGKATGPTSSITESSWIFPLVSAMPKAR